MSTRRLIALLISVWLLELVQADDQVCLVSPYVTAASVKVDGHNLTLSLDIDFSERLLVDGVEIGGNKADGTMTINGSGARTIRASDPGDIVYRKDLIECPRGLKELEYTRDDYMRDAHDYLKKALETSRPYDIIKDCSLLYIYEADFYVPLQGRDYLQVLYHNSMVCYRVLLDPCKYNTSSPSDLVLLNGNSRFRPANIISASYSNKFLFELTPEGVVLIYNFAPGKEPSEKNPLGDPQFRTHLPITAIPTSNAFNAIIGDPSCAGQLKNYHDQMQYRITASDINEFKPFSSVFFSFDDNGLVGILQHSERDRGVSGGVVLNRLRRHMEIRSTDIGLPGVTDDFKIEVAAIWKFPRITRSSDPLLDSLPNHFFMRHINENRVLYFKVPPKPLNENLSIIGSQYDNYIIPDDVTLWIGCKKVVSFYGFYYTLHEYGDNILEVPAKFQLLDQKLTRWPINAVHASSNQFLFFTKDLKVVGVDIANGPDCSQLIVVGEPRVFHLSNYFGGLCYLDRQNFCFPNDRTITRKQVTHHIPLILLISIGMIITIVVTIILVAVFKNFGTEGQTVFSRSRSSHSSGGVEVVSAPTRPPVAPIQKPPQISQVPLMSEASDFKTIESRGQLKPMSKRTPPRKTPPKSSPRKASPIKSHSSQTSSPVGQRGTRRNRNRSRTGAARSPVSR